MEELQAYEKQVQMMDQFNYEMAMKYRHERDYWKGQAEYHQSRATVFRLFFSLSFLFNVLLWLMQ